MLKIKLPGSRKRKRPLTRFINVVKEDVQKSDVTGSFS